MIRCLLLRGNTADSPIAINSRFRATRLFSTEGNQNDFKDEIPAAKELVAAEDGGGSAKDTQDEQHGIQPNQQYRRRELPLSPLMDPAVIAAKQKHHLPKPFPSKNPTTFQQKLSKNPYALALATPVRQCKATHITIPKFFLQDFGLMAHPQTGRPWYVPRDLTSKYSMVHEEEDNSEEAQSSDSSTPVSSSAEPVQGDSQPSERSKPILLKHTRKLGPGRYTLARKSLIAGFQYKNSGYTHKWEVFPSQKQRTIKPIMRVLREAIWRSDMDSFILELMRRRIVGGLVYVARKNSMYIVPCSDWEDGKAKKQVGVMLWTGRKLIEGGTVAEDGVQEHFHGPPELSTLEVRGHKVPVHNLRMLLGKEHLQTLKDKCSSFESEVVVLKKRRVTMDIQLRLWKLQGYLAQYRQFDDTLAPDSDTELQLCREA